MDFNVVNIDLFARFLSKEMNEDERNNFEKRLDSDPEFKLAFEDFISLESTFKDAEVTAFKDFLKTIDESEKEEEISPKRNTVILKLKKMAIAATVAIGCFIGLRYFFSNPSSDKLVSEYFVPYDNVITVRGEKVGIDDGLLFYEEKNYKNALEIFNDFPDNTIALFYTAESLLALKNYDQAIITYKRIINKPSLFTEVCNYHLALAYIGNNNDEKALDLLNKIQKDSDYYDFSQDLIEAIQ